MVRAVLLLCTHQRFRRNCSALVQLPSFGALNRLPQRTLVWLVLTLVQFAASTVLTLLGLARHVRKGFPLNEVAAERTQHKRLMLCEALVVVQATLFTLWLLRISDVMLPAAS